MANVGFDTTIGPSSTLGTVNHFRGSLTSAQILTLFSTPVSLIPGMSGSILFPVGTMLTYRAGSSLYVSTGMPSLIWDSNTTLLASTGTPSFLASSVSSINLMRINGPNGVIYPLSGVTGMGIDLWLSGANPTSGNGTMAVDIWYTTFVP